MSVATSLDSEFMQYWIKLSPLQKESLLSVAKNFVGFNQDIDLTELQNKIMQEEREKYLRGEGMSYTREDVKKAAFNKDHRNSL